MSKIKKPEYLKVPKLKKKELIEWILHKVDDCRGGHDYAGRVHGQYARGWRFCWNVKLYHVDLSFENMLKRFKEYEPSSVHEDCPVWMRGVKEKYDESENSLFEWGVEDACRWLDGGKDGVPEDDGWNQLWDGTPVDVAFTFGGRSGGWLILMWFQGHLMDADIDLMTWDYKTLMQLAEYVAYVKRNVSDRVAEVEHQAAFTFFVNICHGVKTHEEECEKWMLANQSGEH